MAHPSPEDIDFEPNYPPSQRLLSIPSQHIKIERHASEPTPSMTPPTSSSSSMHLLSLPPTPMLVKQHSHPLLPSQSSSCDTLSDHHQPSGVMRRQLSFPSYLMHSASSPSAIAPPVTTTISTPPTMQTAVVSSITQYPLATSSEAFQYSSKTATTSSSYKPLDSEVIVNVRPPVLSKALSQDETTSLSVIVPEAVSLPIEHSTSSSLRNKNDDYHRSISTPMVCA